MREFVEAFYRYRNHPEFMLADNPMQREMGFSVGDEHWRIPLSDLMRWEVREGNDGLPEIEATLREGHRDFYNDWFEVRRRCGLSILTRSGVIRPGETWADVKRRQRESEVRARLLLLSCLNSEQRRTLEEDKYFDVRGPSGEHFRIEEADHSNVYLLDENGEQQARFCGLVYGVPKSDSLLAQKLTLETQPEVFLAVANPVPSTIQDYQPPEETEPITEAEAIEQQRVGLQARADAHNAAGDAEDRQIEQGRVAFAMHQLEEHPEDARRFARPADDPIANTYFQHPGVVEVELPPEEIEELRDEALHIDAQNMTYELEIAEGLCRQ